MFSWLLLANNSICGDPFASAALSTDHQQYSIEIQTAVIGACAQAHNLPIVRTYRDEGESG
jgi:hypothetical protein